MTAIAPTSRTPATMGMLRRLAAWGLTDVEPLGAVPGAAEGASIVEHAQHERLIGVLAVAVEAGGIELEPSAVELLDEANRRAQVWCLRLEVQLLHLAEALGEQGIVPIVVKGPATAHLDHPDPRLRTFADLDLLVRPDDVDLAVSVLERDGAVRMWAERRPGFDRRFAKSVTLRYPDGIEVDLHRTLVDGAPGVRIPLPGLVADAVPFTLGGAELLALSPVHRVLHTAYHLVLGSPTPRLMSLRDLAGHLTGADVDAEIVAEAERWRGAPVLADAVRLTVVTLGIDAPRWEAWADATPVRRAERRAIDRQRQQGSGVGTARLDMLRALPTWRDRAALGWALAVPSGAHLRSRGRRRRDLVWPR